MEATALQPAVQPHVDSAADINAMDTAMDIDMDVDLGLYPEPEQIQLVSLLITCELGKFTV